jgi:hypothetical protein
MEKMHEFALQYGTLSSYKFQKNMDFLLFPYTALVMLEPHDIHLCYKIALSLINLINENEKYENYNAAEVMHAILDTFINIYPPNDFEVIEHVPKELIDSIKPFYETFNNKTNVNKNDYVLLCFICHLGYNGWVRVSDTRQQENATNLGNELVICNFKEKVNQGFVKESNCGFQRQSLDIQSNSQIKTKLKGKTKGKRRKKRQSKRKSIISSKRDTSSQKSLSNRPSKSNTLIPI